jgi:hypothetical protein
MLDFQQAKKKFGQITWLMLGLCFVLLYSCPVKKFLILYFDKTNSEENASAHYMKAHSSQSVKIVYLHRDASVYTALASARTFRPLFPSPWTGILAAYNPTGRHRLPATINLLPLDLQRAFAGDLPRYLQLLRLRI